MTVHEWSGVRILVVEDEWILAMDIEATLLEAGYKVVGPLSNVRDALHAIETEQVEAAVLDLNLQNETSLPVADALATRQTPFLFLSGHSADLLPARHRSRVLVAKPWQSTNLLREVGETLRRPADHRHDRSRTEDGPV